MQLRYRTRNTTNAITRTEPSETNREHLFLGRHFCWPCEMDMGRCRCAVVYLRRSLFCRASCFERSRDDPGADDIVVARDASGVRRIVFYADAHGLSHLTQLQSLVWKFDGIESAAGAI